MSIIVPDIRWSRRRNSTYYDSVVDSDDKDARQKTRRRTRSKSPIPPPQSVAVLPGDSVAVLTGDSDKPLLDGSVFDLGNIRKQWIEKKIMMK